MTKRFNIAVLAGDGIGPEVMPLCTDLLASLSNDYDTFAFDYQHLEAGAACYQACGEALPQETLDASRTADAILLGAMGLPSVRYPDGTEIAPQLDLRFDMNLYAGVRPVKPNPHLPLPLANRDKRPIDFVLIRESTEGLFASHGKGEVHDDQWATDTMKITRGVSERLFDFSFNLATERKQTGFPGVVTCVDKANVFASMAFFRKIFEEVGKGHDQIGMETMYVDAAALNMVRQPWLLDVLVTENMFGDILSDLGAGLMGGNGHGALGRYRRSQRRVSALPRQRTGHRRSGQGQSDRDAVVRRDDDALARWRSWRRRTRRGGRSARASRRGYLRGAEDGADGTRRCSGYSGDLRCRAGRARSVTPLFMSTNRYEN